MSNENKDHIDLEMKVAIISYIENGKKNNASSEMSVT